MAEDHGDRVGAVDDIEDTVARLRTHGAELVGDLRDTPLAWFVTAVAPSALTDVTAFDAYGYWVPTS